MNPAETVDAYFGRVTDLMRKYPNHALPDQLILSTIIAGLQPPQLKLFVKEARPRTWEETLDRAKIWEECNYNAYLDTGGLMIPLEDPVSVAQRNGTLYQPQPTTLPVMAGVVPSSQVLNVTPLQTRQPMTTGTVGQFGYPYPSMPPVQSTFAAPSNPTEAMLLNIAKQMQNLTTTISKEKEKKNKGNTRNNNLFCSNCKGQGHNSTNCPSPNNMRIVCTNCGKEGHPIEDCWHLGGNRNAGPNMMMANNQFDVNQVQGGPRSGWNGLRQNGNWNQQRNSENTRNGGPSQNQCTPDYIPSNHNVNSGQNNQRGGLFQVACIKPPL